MQPDMGVLENAGGLVPVARGLLIPRQPGRKIGSGRRGFRV